MFLDVLVSFIAIWFLAIALASYMSYRKRRYRKLHPPALSALEQHKRRYILTGDEGELEDYLKEMEVQ